MLSQESQDQGRIGSAGAPKGLQLDSQVSYFNRISKDLITKSTKNLLLGNKKPRLSLEKSSFLLDRGGCIVNYYGSISSLIIFYYYTM